MTSYIYVITDETHIKVGVSRNPSKRIKALQTGSPKPLRVVNTYCLPAKKVYALESRCHQQISSYYLKRGEWFETNNCWHVCLLVEEICIRQLITDCQGLVPCRQSS